MLLEAIPDHRAGAADEFSLAAPPIVTFQQRSKTSESAEELRDCLL
jgi:hypothetical protein